jgi:hypothetical protein
LLRHTFKEVGNAFYGFKLVVEAGIKFQFYRLVSLYSLEDYLVMLFFLNVPGGKGLHCVCFELVVTVKSRI